MAELSEKDNIIDLLKRAYEMEENMASALIDICNSNPSIEDVGEDMRTRLFNMLNSIKEDTLRHKTTVEELLSKYEGANE